MTRLLFTAFLTACCFPATTFGQARYDEPVARIISQKMCDSLSLDQETTARIYRINLHLAREKQKLRTAGKPASGLAGGFQQIENQRDSLYKKVLSKDQFERYEKKKTGLISVN